MFAMDDKKAVDEMKEVNVAHAAEEAEDATTNALPVAAVEDRASEKKLIRKIDLQLLPILFLMLIAAFLDRINIGNARLFGLETDLNMHGDQFNIALFVFFIPYILCELPANIVLKNLKPHWWLSGMIFGFGMDAHPALFSLNLCRRLINQFGRNQVFSPSARVSRGALVVLWLVVSLLALSRPASSLVSMTLHVQSSSEHVPSVISTHIYRH